MPSESARKTVIAIIGEFDVTPVTPHNFESMKERLGVIIDSHRTPAERVANQLLAASQNLRSALKYNIGSTQFLSALQDFDNALAKATAKEPGQ